MVLASIATAFSLFHLHLHLSLLSLCIDDDIGAIDFQSEGQRGKGHAPELTAFVCFLLLFIFDLVSWCRNIHQSRPYSMIYFATYEQLKEMAWQRMAGARRSRGGHGHDGGDDALSLTTDEVLPFTTIMGCAAVACGIAAGISNTVDVVKTRWQTSILSVTSNKKNSSGGQNSPHSSESLSSARRIARHMFQQGGLASFAQGMGARVLWMIPSVTISMSVFEWIKAHGLVT